MKICLFVVFFVSLVLSARCDQKCQFLKFKVFTQLCDIEAYYAF